MIDHFRIKRGISSFLFRIIYKRFFKYYGKGTKIISALNIMGFQNISIGDYVYIAYKSSLSAIPLSGETECLLEIGSETQIGNFNHIFCTKSIKIGKHVLTADKVYISDNTHQYKDISIPIRLQPIVQLNSVEIGDGTWIGENVCIMGAKIGKNCVIGANSIVNKDIPDYCLVIGSPAKIIKKFNLSTGIWEKINNF